MVIRYSNVPRRGTIMSSLAGQTLSTLQDEAKASQNPTHALDTSMARSEMLLDRPRVWWSMWAPRAEANGLTGCM